MAELPTSLCICHVRTVQATQPIYFRLQYTAVGTTGAGGAAAPLKFLTGAEPLKIGVNSAKVNDV